ncbi:uncharacterized protein [Ptychodera flava]|uniref:uncharacterized protein n=1 Tax=Ptychodera flava TaxID=63121 RepID=UPI00396A1483
MGEKGAEKGKVFSTATSDQPEINADSNSHSSCDCKPESPQIMLEMVPVLFQVLEEKKKNMKILKTLYKIQIREMEKSCTNEDADKARDDFIKLLQCVKKNLRCRIIDLRGRSIDSQKKEKAKKIIVEKERQNKVCRVEPANEDVVKLYSENEKMLDDIVKKACKALDITPPKGDSKFIKDTHTKDHQSAQSMKTSKESDGNATKNTHISEKVKESDMNTREKSKSSNNPSGKEIDMLRSLRLLQ